MTQTASPPTRLATYTVGEGALGDVRRLMRRLTAKAERAGAPGLSVDATYIGSRPDGSSLYQLEVVASGVPQIGGFELVGKVEHKRAGTNVVHDFVGAGLVDRFSKVPASCAHCGRARRRVETFLLRGDAGEVRQVGRNCLGDYALASTGAVTAALGAANLIAELSGALREWDEKPTKDQVSLPTYLELVAEALMRGGWVSAGKSRKTGDPSTAEQALRLLDGAGTTVARPAARGLAAQALRWVRSLPPQNHEYLDSLRGVCTTDLMQRRDAGLAASVLWAYRSRHHLKVVPPVDVEPARAITRWDADEYQRLVCMLEPPIGAADHLMFCQAAALKFEASAEYMTQLMLEAEGQPDGTTRQAELKTAGDIIAYLAHYLSARGMSLSKVLEESVLRIVRTGEQIDMAIPSLRAQSG